MYRHYISADIIYYNIGKNTYICTSMHIVPPHTSLEKWMLLTLLHREEIETLGGQTMSSSTFIHKNEPQTLIQNKKYMLFSFTLAFTILGD